MAHYIDTSALAKLLVAEPESGALRQWIAFADATLVSSDLTRTELLRAVRRRVPERMVQAREVLDSLVLLHVTADEFEAAALLDPAVLRTLDAIHIATALTLGDELESIVAYDERLMHAAESVGIRITSPTNAA
jgi:predicted nucleic acid-binding protein